MTIAVGLELKATKQNKFLNGRVCFNVEDMSYLDKQRKYAIKILKKAIKINVCVPKSNSKDRYAIACDVTAYHLVYFVSIWVIYKCQSVLIFFY